MPDIRYEFVSVAKPIVSEAVRCVRIFVKTLTDEDFDLGVTANDSVGAVQAQIEDKAGVEQKCKFTDCGPAIDPPWRG